jgi:protein ImuB
MSLWLCLRFSQLPLQCLDRSEDQPIVVLAQQRVMRANDSAATLGIEQGMGTATVRALAESQAVQLLERDTAAEQRCLQQLCCWAYSISPSLHPWREDCLQLEIGSCLNLYRGLDALLAEVAGGISSRGYHAQYGLAATPKAAWLLSFAPGADAMAIEQSLEQRLAPLPLQLLDEFSSTVDSLRRAGLHTLGDVLNLPTQALGRRCGQKFTHFLQQLLGKRDDLQPDYQPPTTFSDAYWFGYEVKANDELQPAVELLLQALCRFLRNTQLRTSGICWQFIGIDRSLHSMTVRSTSSHSDWRSWYSLTRIHMERQQLKVGVEGLMLNCEQLQPNQLESADLFCPNSQREPMDSLLDRLRSRLGLQAIAKVGCRDEHLPEYAVHKSSRAGTGDSSDKGNIAPNCAQRPFWLMPKPQRLDQRGSQLYWNGALRLIYGPERIEDNWWADPVSRDYYVAEDVSGQYYWIFRDRMARQWHIHGIFA